MTVQSKLKFDGVSLEELGEWLLLCESQNAAGTRDSPAVFYCLKQPCKIG